MPSATLNITLNGSARSATVSDGTEPLLYTLRNQMGQLGPKFACGVSQCGACTVLVNGTEVRSCVVPVTAIAQGAEVTTLDGLAATCAKHGRGQERQASREDDREDRDDDDEELHPLQKAFIAEQAAQCGFCMNGIVMGSLAWLNRRFAAGNRSVPSAAAVAAFLSGKAPEGFNGNVYICRCGAHQRVIRAIRRGAREMLK